MNFKHLALTSSLLVFTSSAFSAPQYNDNQIRSYIKSVISTPTSGNVNSKKYIAVNFSSYVHDLDTINHKVSSFYGKTSVANPFAGERLTSAQKENNRAIAHVTRVANKVAYNRYWSGLSVPGGQRLLMSYTATKTCGKVIAGKATAWDGFGLTITGHYAACMALVKKV